MMRRFLFALLLSCAPACADQAEFRIIDLRWLEHPEKGDGVEIVYEFARKPDDGDAALMAFALSECNRVAPKYVPMVLSKLGKTKADFVAMTFRFGGAVGSYTKFFALYKDGVCSDIE